MPEALAVVNDPALLVGTWRFQRTIVDGREGDICTASGQAILAWADGAIRWHEDGVLLRAGMRIPVMRTLVLRRRAESAESAEGTMRGPWAVEFDDGRPFHPWLVDTPFDHVCGSDIYHGRIVMRGDDESNGDGNDASSEDWNVEWNVVGPMKSYVMTTSYRRV